MTIKPQIGPSDCRGGIAVGTLYGIDHELLPRAEVRIDVLPDDRALAGDVEEPAKPTLVDERIPVWQTLSVGNPGTEEIRNASLLIFPHFRRRIGGFRMFSMGGRLPLRLKTVLNFACI